MITKAFSSIVYWIMLNVHLGSIGAGAGGQQGATTKQSGAAILAQRCLQGALRNNTSAGHVWANLAAAYSMSRRMGLASQCLEQVFTFHLPSYHHPLQSL